jgi:hypothetical protein
MKREFPTEAPDGLLWHYTGFDACKSILEKGTMYASNLEFLNDTEEFNYALKLIRRAFEKLDRIPADVGLPPMPPERLYDFLHTRITHFFYQNGYFVTCFSSKPDDLSQWRAYAGSIPGFAIGFDKEALRARLKMYGLRLYKAIYKPARQDWIIEAGLSRLFAQTREAQNEPGSRLVAFASACGRLGGNRWLTIPARFKAPAFGGESEYRAVSIGELVKRSGPDGTTVERLKLQFRVSGSLVVPYYEWGLREENEAASPIRAVMVGPCPHKMQVASAVQQMCPGQIKVSVSNIAYRNW